MVHIMPNEPISISYKYSNCSRQSFHYYFTQLYELFPTNNISTDFTRSLTHQIDNDGIAEQQWEAKQHPRKIRSLKAEKAEEVHTNVRIASTPHVHKHYRECLAKKHQTDEYCYKLLSAVNENPKL